MCFNGNNRSLRAVRVTHASDTHIEQHQAPLDMTRGRVVLHSQLAAGEGMRSWRNDDHAGCAHCWQLAAHLMWAAAAALEHHQGPAPGADRGRVVLNISALLQSLECSYLASRAASGACTCSTPRQNRSPWAACCVPMRAANWMGRPPRPAAPRRCWAPPHAPALQRLPELLRRMPAHGRCCQRGPCAAQRMWWPHLQCSQYSLSAPANSPPSVPR